MKKLLLFLLVFPILLGSCSSDNDSEGPGNTYLYATQIDRIDFKYGEPDLTSRQRVLYRIFNEAGYVQSYDSIHVSWVGPIPHKASYKYNDKNQIIEETRQGLSKERIEYAYNSDGTLSEEKIYSEKGLNEIIKYTYNNGKLVRKDDDNITIDVDYFHLYEYNSKGLLSLENQYNSDESLFYSYKYEYDTNNSLIKKTSISPEGKEQVQIDYVYKYDGKGRATELISKKLNGDINITKYIYNFESGLLEKMDFFDGKTNEQEYYQEYKYIYK